MPTFQNTTFSSFFKRIFQISQTSNVGVDATTRRVETGDGANTVLALSDDQLLVQPNVDDTSGVFIVNKVAGNAVLAVDTVNSKVLGGASQTALNTQYAHFGVSSASGTASAMVADTHYAMGSSTASSFNDTNPATSLTISTTAYSIIRAYW